MLAATTWPSGVKEYCEQTQCGPLVLWDRMDLFAVPVIFFSVAIAVCSNMFEVDQCVQKLNPDTFHSRLYIYLLIILFLFL